VRQKRTVINSKISTEITEWATCWVIKDKEYLQQRARFAPEPIKSVAKLVLTIADGDSKK
jgi:hypothetical protein